MPTSSAIIGETAAGITGAFEANLLVCPDNCIDELVSALDGRKRNSCFPCNTWTWIGRGAGATTRCLKR